MCHALYVLLFMYLGFVLTVPKQATCESLGNFEQSWEGQYACRSWKVGMAETCTYTGQCRCTVRNAEMLMLSIFTYITYLL